MNAVTKALIEGLEAQGVTFRIEGEQVVITDPDDVVGEGVLQALGDRAEEIVALLARRDFERTFGYAKSAATGDHTPQPGPVN